MLCTEENCTGKRSCVKFSTNKTRLRGKTIKQISFDGFPPTTHHEKSAGLIFYRY
jgi:hypothetical protein